MSIRKSSPDHRIWTAFFVIFFIVWIDTVMIFGILLVSYYCCHRRSHFHLSRVLEGESVIIQVLGRLGNYFYLHPDCDIDLTLENLRYISWLRSDPLWRERAIRDNGRMINNEEAIILTCNALKQELNIPLDESEIKKERAFARKVD